MNVAFVDTSILVDVLINIGPNRDRAIKALEQFEETQLPVYGIKEFQSGALGSLVWLHNKLQTTKSVGDTLLAIQRLLSHKRNLPATALEALAREMKSLGKKVPAELAAKYGETSIDEINADACKHVFRYRIMQAWEQRRTVTSHVVWPCACFPETAPQMKRDLIVMTPRGCTGPKNCAMAFALRASADDLAKLLRAVRGISGGRGSQYQVLRHLVRTPKREIVSDANCRALGDAIFAFLCPDGAVILTTNLRDHHPLAAAVGKVALHPESLKD